MLVFAFEIVVIFINFLIALETSFLEHFAYLTGFQSALGQDEWMENIGLQRQTKFRPAEILFVSGVAVFVSLLASKYCPLKGKL